jgi:hypothetical protein
MPASKVATPPKVHHFDRFADEFAVRLADGDPDESLTTKQVAKLLHVSEQWLEIGRIRGYGPPFVKLGPRMVRYPRGKLVKYLRSRPKGGAVRA